MARAVEGLHSFACTPTRFFTNGMNHAFAFLTEACPHLLTPEGWKAELAKLAGDDISRLFTDPKTVSHPSTNRTDID